MRLQAEVGYGLPAFRGKGAVTPFAGLSTTGSRRDWRAGALWTRGPALEMALEATRREAAGARPAHGIGFRLTWRPGARGPLPGAAGHTQDMDGHCPAGTQGADRVREPPMGSRAAALASVASTCPPSAEVRLETSQTVPGAPPAG